MIINTGNRTDIPGYYSQWFYRRIEEGRVLVRNPYYPSQVIEYRLDPEVVDCICFCTKNPGPMLAGIDKIRDYGKCFYVTITPYGKEMEPFVPDKEKVLEDFCILSDKVGKEAVSWRYDPVFLWGKYSLEFHIKAFTKMADRLRGKTERCVISFIDLYEKTKRNFPGVSAVPKADTILLTKEMVKIAGENGMRIYPCGEGDYLSEYGADCSGCMSQAVIERAIGKSLLVPKGKKPAREGCICLLGSDIGMYNTCGHGCLYCYANYDRKCVEENMAKHDVTSPLLIGNVRKDDVIKQAVQESWIDEQMKLFF